MSYHHVHLDRKRWQHVRLAALDRDGYRCQSCGKAGRLEVDHVQPLDKGGDAYALGNLQALCRGCHIAKTRAENRKPSAARDAWEELVQSRMETPKSLRT